MQPIGLDALRDGWKTLTALMDRYRPESHEWAALCEARRLTEVELGREGFDYDARCRILHGD